MSKEKNGRLLDYQPPLIVRGGGPLAVVGIKSQAALEKI